MTTYTCNNDSVWYYCNKDGQLQEPVTAEKLEELARQGAIAPGANVLLKTDTPVDPSLTLTNDSSILTQEEVEDLLDMMSGYQPFGLHKSAGQYRATLLHVAAINENIEFAKFLIQNGARVYKSDSDCETPLRKAVHENKSAELIKFLVAAEIAVEEGYDGEPFYNDGNEWSKLGNRRLNSEQLKNLQTMHEGFSRKCAAKLSAMLKTSVDVKLTSVDQLAYSEFLFGLDSPTYLNLLRVEPLECNMILDITPSIIYPMIDRMLGGSDGGWLPTYYRQAPKRPLNEGESCIARRLTDEFLKELEHAWEDVFQLKLNFSVVQVESNPQIVQIVAPNEAVVVLVFEMAMAGVRGCMSLCFRYDFFEGIQKASLHGTSDDALFEKAEQKLQEVLLLLSKIHKSNKEQTSSINAAIARLQNNEPGM